MKLIPISQRDTLRAMKAWWAVYLNNVSPQTDISVGISSLLPLGFL